MGLLESFSRAVSNDSRLRKGFEESEHEGEKNASLAWRRDHFRRIRRCPQGELSRGRTGIHAVLVKKGRQALKEGGVAYRRGQKPNILPRENYCWGNKLSGETKKGLGEKLSRGATWEGRCYENIPVGNSTVLGLWKGIEKPLTGDRIRKRKEFRSGSKGWKLGRATADLFRGSHGL